MANRSRRLGTHWESAIVQHFRAAGIDADRIRQTGAEDEGDIVARLGGVPLVIEAKAVKSMALAEWVTEAETEARNWSAHRNKPPAAWAVVAKRRQHRVGAAYVVMTLDAFLAHFAPSSDTSVTLTP